MPPEPRPAHPEPRTASRRTHTSADQPTRHATPAQDAARPGALTASGHRGYKAQAVHRGAGHNPDRPGPRTAPRPVTGSTVQDDYRREVLTRSKNGGDKRQAARRGALTAVRGAGMSNKDVGGGCAVHEAARNGARNAAFARDADRVGALTAVRDVGTGGEARGGLRGPVARGRALSGAGGSPCSRGADMGDEGQGG